MKLEIKLADPKFCNGCFALKATDACSYSYASDHHGSWKDYHYINACLAGIFDKKEEEKIGEGYKTIRPQKCVEENGE